MRAAFLQLLLIAALTVGAALAINQWHPNRPPLYFNPKALQEGEVDIAKAIEWSEAGELVWIDARPRAKYEAGHVEGAILLNEQDDFNLLLMESIAELQNNFDKRFVVYCATEICAASRRVANLLRERGFPEVYTLNGGVISLREVGLLE